MNGLKASLHVILAAATMFSITVEAQPPVFVQPQALSQEGRFMPGSGNEAIVRTRYTVKADGTTDDIEILGGFSNQSLDNTLRQTIRNWTFTPGTVNGEAADFYNQEYTFSIRVNPNAPAVPALPPGGRRRGAPPAQNTAAGENAEASPSSQILDLSKVPAPELALSSGVREEFDKITAMVAEKDHDKALKAVDKLIRRELHSVFDYCLAQEMKSSILMAMEKPFEALEASKLATVGAENAQGGFDHFLTPDILEDALRKKFLLAATLRQAALAWETYELLQSRFSLAPDDKIHEQARTIRSLLDSPEPLPLLAKIDDDKWTYTPVRRIFTVTNVDGRLSRIDARCERKNLQLEYQADVDWTLPEALGRCQLDFVGKNGTQFTVYEFTE
ncbi:MAG: TonB family protein [Pseudomonadales bacterium]|nr:TonB family protein [Pseudomonadales bacterium]